MGQASPHHDKPSRPQSDSVKCGIKHWVRTPDGRHAYIANACQPCGRGLAILTCCPRRPDLITMTNSPAHLDIAALITITTALPSRASPGPAVVVAALPHASLRPHRGACWPPIAGGGMGPCCLRPGPAPYGPQLQTPLVDRSSSLIAVPARIPPTIWSSCDRSTRWKFRHSTEATNALRLWGLSVHRQTPGVTAKRPLSEGAE